MQKGMREVNAVRKIEMKKVCLGMLCVAALWGMAGCGDKSNSEAKTAQQTQDFKGHQPTPEQLQAAMSKMAPHPPAPPNSTK
jgi:hypothetical protein